MSLVLEIVDSLKKILIDILVINCFYTQILIKENVFKVDLLLKLSFALHLFEFNEPNGLL